MKNTRLITTAAVILAGFAPASVALASNGADDAVQQVSAPAAKVVTAARTADDGGRHQNRTRSRTSGRDDHGRHGAHHRRGARRIEAGDDNGGRRVRGNRVEAGDDHGGRGRGSDDV